MIFKPQLQDLIERTLKRYTLYSESAMNLLLGTAAQESGSGTYLRQNVKNFDPQRHAVGIMQMGRTTFNWLKEKYWYVVDKTKLESFEELEYNLEYAILFARLRYRVVKEPLPKADDIEGLARYWKRYSTLRLVVGQ